MAERKLDDNLFGISGYPQDVTAERALLALCLKDSKIIDDNVGNKLVPEDFYDIRNAYTFLAIMELYVDNANIDPYTVCSTLEKRNWLKQAGGNAYVLNLVDNFAVKSSADDYVNIIREKSKRRKLSSYLEKMLNLAKGGGQESASQLVDATIGKLSSMRDEPDGVGFESIASILHANINEIRAVSMGQKNNYSIKTGFTRLDFKLGGLRPGTLNVLAARPGMGKTAFAINIATNVAELYNVPVNIFSLEMSKSEIGNRILAAKSATPADKLQRANVSSDDLFELASAVKKLSPLPIYIDDSSGVTPVSMLSSCKELASKGQLGLVIVDYLQLMSSGSAGANVSRQQEISDISRSLKLLAKEMKVPVIALSQLSRNTEKRDDKTPMLSDLRDSGAIEQDADSVWFIERNDYYNKKDNSNEPTDARVIIAKNRHGEVGDVKLKWIGARTLFTNIDDNRTPTPPPEGRSGSGYSAKVSGDVASANYHFDDEPVAPPPSQEPPAYPDPVEAPPFREDEFVPPATDDDAPVNAENDNMFGAGMNQDFPEGFL